EHVTSASETSKPTQLDNSVVCEPTLSGNNTNINTQEITVLGLGAALGLCVLLIFGLAYFILRRRKCKKINASTENYPRMRQ
ncbi:putative immune-type receptor 13, partial [Clarias magur]